MTVQTETLYSSTEACRLADISYRQLDYWCRIGTVTPAGPARPGSGARRRWTTQQVHVLAVLAAVGGHVPISALDELGAMLLDWDAATWDDTLLFVSRRGGVYVWAGDYRQIPLVSTAVVLGVVRQQVSERHAHLPR